MDGSQDQIFDSNSSSTSRSTPPFEESEVEHDIVAPIVAIGLSLVFPDDATSADSFWTMLMEGQCASRDFPEDRINLNGFYEKNSERQGTLPLTGGHFVRHNIAAFDAPFFSITPAEAEAMDPLQRGMLETTYRAFENAGITLEALRGSNTSVHIGCFSTDATSNVSKDTDSMSKYVGTGTAPSILSNRLSWFFDLKGPSITIDTACSSSLVALDLACQSLQSGRSDMAVVGGCNLIYSADMTMALSKLGFLSQESHCYSFDSRANGYARGEGFGVVILKRVSDAIRDRDTMRAIIRATGSNQDGHTPGLTLPSKDSQADLIRDTYRKAGLNMMTTRFFEAHGTGTPVGDPIEVNAIGSAFRHPDRQGKPLYIGAVKANIGHLEGASGVAGLIKTILVLEKGIIPPNSNFKRLNPLIDAEFLNIQFPLKGLVWPCHGLRRASINSFGFGGTNSHAIVDDAYNFLRLRSLPGKHATAENAGEIENSTIVSKSIPPSLTDKLISPTVCKGTSNTIPRLFVWSAYDEAGISRLAEQYRLHFGKIKLCTTEIQEYLESLSYTLNVRRTSLTWRSYMLAGSVAELQDLELSQPSRSVFEPKLAYIFTGQGAQWYAMGRELFIYSVFENSLSRAQEILKQLGSDWLLIDELMKGEEDSRVDDPSLSQPLCTALQIAVVDLLQSFNISPSVIVGHSSGEIAAAYCVGALSQRSALRVSYYRGSLASELAMEDGVKQTMMSVGLSEKEISPYLAAKPNGNGNSRLTLSCVNSPYNVTISGKLDDIDDLEELLRGIGTFTRKIKVNLAYHSPQMEKIAARYFDQLGNLEPGNGREVVRASFISSVTGQITTNDELSRGEYWVQNMVKPVRFEYAMRKLCSQGGQEIRKKLDLSHRGVTRVHNILEIGPHAALRGPVREILRFTAKDGDIGYASALLRNRSAIETVLEAVGKLYCWGHSANLKVVNRFDVFAIDHPAVLTNLPGYAFNHSQTHWHESRISKNYRLRQQRPVSLLGSQVSDWNPLQPRWRNILRVSDISWVEDHQVNGSTIFPAAGMLVMAIEAARQTAESREIVGYSLRDVTFNAPINLSLNPNGVETQLTLRSQRDASDKNNAWLSFSIHICENGQWAEACKGSVQVDYASHLVDFEGGTEVEEYSSTIQHEHKDATQRCRKVADSRYVYQRLKANGLDYGPAFQSLSRLRYSENVEATADLFLYSGSIEQNTVIHPTSLDGLFQLSLIALTKGGTESIPTTVTTRINKLWLSNTGLCVPDAEMLLAYSKTEVKGYRVAEAYISALSKADKQVMIEIEGFEATAITESQSLTSEGKPNQAFYNVDWKPDVDMLDDQETYEYCAKSQETQPEMTDFLHDLTFVLFAAMYKAYPKLKDISPPSAHLHDYLRWMTLQIESFNTGILDESLPEWNELLLDETYVNVVLDRVAAFNKQGELIVTICKSLTQIVSGEIDLLDLFDHATIEELRALSEQSQCLDTFSKYLDLLVHKNPGMNILQIGGSNESMTASVLNAMRSDGEQEPGSPKYSQYDLTGRAPSALESAQRRLAGYSRIKYSTLDVEENPTEQGFSAHSYDLIIAVNMLHDTTNLTLTFQNIRKILKPGGKFVIAEILKPPLLRVTFALGLLPEWWSAFRAESSSIPRQTWEETLRATGFSGLDVEFQDFESNHSHSSSILITTAIQKVPEVLLIPPILILALSHMKEHQLLATRLQETLKQNEGSICTITTFEDFIDLEVVACNYRLIILEDVHHTILRNMGSRMFKNLRGLLHSSQSVLWVTLMGAQLIEPNVGLAHGLTRVLRTENAKAVITTLALKTHGSTFEKEVARIQKVLGGVGLSADQEPEYVDVSGLLQISRLVEASDLNTEVFKRISRSEVTQYFHESPPLNLSIRTPGLLDSFHFLEDTNFVTSLEPDEIEIKVHAVGLNFLDCLTALGRVNAKSFGSECSGVITRIGSKCNLRLGDRVIMCSPSVFGTYARSTEDSAMIIPDSLGLTAAAAVPTTFITVFYGLCEVARMKKGETILIHAGAGGTGQAAIQLATNAGLQVFTTVGSKEKKQLLIERYGISESHILYSRDLSFRKGIKRLTNGRGVDIILNSLAGEGLVASWECVAPYGRFIEIGKKDIYSHGSLPMFPFAANVSFSAIDLAFEPRNRPPAIRRSFESVIALLEEGKIQPAYPLTVFNLSEIEKAFRSMQSGKNSGKIVIDLSQEAKVPMVLDPKPTYQFKTDATYVIAGGLGGLGRSIARWMASRGAMNLILLSLSGPTSEKAQVLVTELRQKGVRVETPLCDVANISSLQAVVNKYTGIMPSIQGCIQGAVVLKDATFETMSVDDWNTCCDPKVQGSWNLHTLLPAGMDFFILLSSVAGIIGNGGQANYAAANTYQDALARYRISQGEKATALNLGALLSEGLLAENEAALGKSMRADILPPMAQEELLALLDFYCDPHLSVSALKCQAVTGIETPANIRGKGLEVPYWMHQPLFRHMHQINSSINNMGTSSSSSGADQKAFDFEASFATTASLAEAGVIVANEMKKKLSQILGIPEDTMDSNKPVSHYGVDSLTAVELRNWFTRALNAEVAIFDILGEPSIAAVGRSVAGKSQYRQAAWVVM